MPNITVARIIFERKHSSIDSASMKCVPNITFYICLANFGRQNLKPVVPESDGLKAWQLFPPTGYIINNE